MTEETAIRIAEAIEQCARWLGFIGIIALFAIAIAIIAIIHSAFK